MDPIEKYISPESFDFGMNASALLPLFSKGVDTDFIRKRAMDRPVKDLEIEIKPGYTYVHLISVGAMEKYGGNTRADAFNIDEALHRPAYPEPGQEEIKLDGGLKKYHDEGYKALGGVYRSHKSRVASEQNKPSGYIEKAFINTPMARGELIVGLENDKWGDVLQNIAEEKPVFWSMGCLTDYDICYACGHVRKGRVGSLCDHLTHYAGQVDKNGIPAWAITDRPRFHDISQVFSPAEKISFLLRKVASDGLDFGNCSAPVRPAETLRKYNKKPFTDRKLLLKLASDIDFLSSRDNNISGYIKSLASAFKTEGGYGIPEEIKGRLSKYAADDVLAESVTHHTLLPVDYFKDLVRPDAEVSAGLVRKVLPGVITKIANDARAMDLFLEDGSYEPGERRADPELTSLMSSLEQNCSISADAVKYRCEKSVFNKEAGDDKPLCKEASEDNKDEAEILAREYLRYTASVNGNYTTGPENLTAVSLMCTLI